MLKRIWLHYLPYGVIDLLLTIALISEIVNQRWDLILANLPLLTVGLWSFGRRLGSLQDDPAD